MGSPLCSIRESKKYPRRFPTSKVKRRGPWLGNLATFREYRAKGAFVGFAPDPRTGHECGDSRYLAIPFLDACLAMRLPDNDAKDQTLKPVDTSQAWLAPVLAETKLGRRRRFKATGMNRSGRRTEAIASVDGHVVTGIGSR